jgi:hypothetical protein
LHPSRTFFDRFGFSRTTDLYPSHPTTRTPVVTARIIVVYVLVFMLELAGRQALVTR